MDIIYILSDIPRDLTLDMFEQIQQSHVRGSPGGGNLGTCYLHLPNACTCTVPMHDLFLFGATDVILSLVPS